MQGQCHIVECPIHVIGCAKGPAAHPEDPIALEIRAHGLRFHQENELRRQGYPGNCQGLPFTVNDCRKPVAEIEAVRLGKVLIDHDLVIFCRIGEPAFPDV